MLGVFSLYHEVAENLKIDKLLFKIARHFRILKLRNYTKGKMDRVLQKEINLYQDESKREKIRSLKSLYKTKCKSKLNPYFHILSFFHC